MEEITETNKSPMEGGDSPDGNELKKMLNSANSRVTELEQALSGKETEIAALKSGEAGLEAKIKGLTETLSVAVKEYRTLTAQLHPDILAELLVGDSVQAIQESVNRGKEIVARVKHGMEDEINRNRFPAGAPGRGKVDLDMTPREKIQQGISSRLH
jgi:archaellum component FlaC